MRVQGGNGPKNVGKSSGNSRSGSAPSGFSLAEEATETAQTASSAPTSSVQDVSALLALQGVDDALSGKKRKAVRRGNKMLDLLEEIRMGLLSGTLSLVVLEQLQRLAQDHEASGDERIDALLDEIGLRAQVEIAKLESHKGA